jgi:hypothetical protein
MPINRSTEASREMPEPSREAMASRRYGVTLMVTVAVEAAEPSKAS